MPAGAPRISPRTAAGPASATCCCGRPSPSSGPTCCSGDSWRAGAARCCRASPPSACSSSTPASGSSGPAAMPKTFLLTDEFPPVQTGIARLMGEIARRYPKGELLVSTGQHRDASETDGAYATATLDRLPLSTRALRNIIGLMLWSRRVASLARQHKPRVAWCDSIPPPGYPPQWAPQRVRTKYGGLVHRGGPPTELHRVPPP